MSTAWLDEFHARVAAWLLNHSQVRVPVVVTKVEAEGSDWNGDTEGGFYSGHTLTISYQFPAHVGEDQQVYTVFLGNGDAEEQASLWSEVLR